MKILLYGEHWEGTHIDCISKVLETKKVQFQVFDFFQLLNKSSNRIANKILRTLLYKRSENTINQRFISNFITLKPDVVFVSKGMNIYPDTLKYMKKNGARLVNWNPDDFFNMKNSTQHLQKSLALYDIIFSARYHRFDYYKKVGILNSVYLEWYYIPWLHKILNSGSIAKKRVITFIGTYSKRRENIINSIDKIFPIEIWGAGWYKSKLRLKRNVKVHDEVLAQKEFPAIMAKSLVNLNILTVENKDLTNLKMFEITASGGLLLTEENDFCKNILKENQDCFYYTELNLNDRLNTIFNEISENHLEQIRLSGHDRIISNGNSINDRVDYILKYFKENFNLY